MYENVKFACLCETAYFCSLLIGSFLIISPKQLYAFSSCFYCPFSILRLSLLPLSSTLIMH